MEIESGYNTDQLIGSAVVSLESFIQCRQLLTIGKLVKIISNEKIKFLKALVF